MSHAIPLPDDLYQQLATVAARQGETPEDLLAAWVRRFVGDTSASVESQALSRSQSSATDPLAPFIGAFTSRACEEGWIERHDDVLFP